jgi:hypothetical protein
MLYGQPFIDPAGLNQTMVKLDAGEELSDFVAPINRLDTVK